MKNIESPQPYYDQGGVTIYHGDNREVLLTLPDSSVDAVIADPPYGISFMNKRWDYDIPTVGQWEECLRVLNPGGHMLVFCGTRTQHRMAVNVEDAGFEIRDAIAWLYGSGFPKSLDVSKAIDRAAGAEREVVATGQAFGRGAMGNKSRVEQGYRPTEVNPDGGHAAVTAPATDAAKQWDGWGTALKPAMELITVARKPLDGTVASNVLEYGTGALNIDGCRISVDEAVDDPRLGGKGTWSSKAMAKNAYGEYEGKDVGSSPKGRWPANVIERQIRIVQQCVGRFLGRIVFA